MRFVGEVESKAARFRKEPPVGRRMAGLMRRRKRDRDRVGDRTIGDKLYRGVYIKGRKRVDNTAERIRAKRKKNARTAKDSRRVNRMVSSGMLRKKLSRLATRFDWTPAVEEKT